MIQNPDMKLPLQNADSIYYLANSRETFYFSYRTFSMVNVIISKYHFFAIHLQFFIRYSLKDVLVIHWSVQNIN